MHNQQSILDWLVHLIGRLSAYLAQAYNLKGREPEQVHITELLVRLKMHAIIYPLTCKW